MYTILRYIRYNVQKQQIIYVYIITIYAQVSVTARVVLSRRLPIILYYLAILAVACYIIGILAGTYECFFYFKNNM